jgi:hypothetical protein
MDKNEIYGWLIGYQKKATLHVLVIFECTQFEQQSFISAFPNAREFQKLTAALPQGIGPIGIYHSHPFSSEVFHSHTDDSTLLSLNNQFPNCLSIVTNGKEINFYQMDENNAIKEIGAKYEEPPIPKLLNVRIDEGFVLKVGKTLTSNEQERKKLRNKILNATREFFENTWDDMNFYCKHEKISSSGTIDEYLTNNLNGARVEIRVPEEYKSKGKIQLEIENNDGKEGISVIEQDLSIMNFELNLSIPIYIIDESARFDQITSLIKTELLSNNLIPKLYHSELDFEHEVIIIPRDHLLTFFGFYLKFTFFDDIDVNQETWYNDQIEFLLGIFKIIELIKDTAITDQVKDYLNAFLKDVDEIEILFRKSDKVKNILRMYKKMWGINSSKMKS